MKVILSRKGLDSANGGCPSPIMPDGTLLSMPIPSYDDICYSDLAYRDKTYDEILCDLKPSWNKEYCHLDPDIRPDVRINKVRNWKAGFGQCEAALGVLNNAGVESGDLFLFFGWFRQTEYVDGRLRYVKKNDGDFYHYSDLHVIYGYMQIGDILTTAKELSTYKWHPHSMFGEGNNAIYTPTEKLSFNKKMNGFGVLDYRQDRVLTMKNQSRGVWNEYPFLMPEHVYGDRKNSAKDEGLYYCGIWQELVVYESDGLMDWVKSILR